MGLPKMFGDPLPVERGGALRFHRFRCLIDQALTDFSHEDLPVDTVIKVLTNKYSKKFLDSHDHV